MTEHITLKRTIPFDKLGELLKKIEFRGLYNKDGEKIKPYKKAVFSIATVYPAESLTSSPTIKIGSKKEFLFSPQPTVYSNQTEIIKIVDDFLSKNKLRVNKLKNAVEYDWQGRGVYNMLPPIIEKHTYQLNNGFIDLDQLIKSFENLYVKDAKGNLHHVLDRHLKDYFIDEVSSIKHMDIFHSNAPLINYGIRHNHKQDFYIICDGSHRIDYSIEYLGQPITVILVEPKSRPLIPYYAFPMPFWPTIRLSSKLSEKMYPRLERDKVHLFNDFLKKTLHYDWTNAGLNVGKLRSNVDIN
ncbi:MAG: hypothetical protein HY507_02300 [Candidatus Zambryskibacteria bacterium]|nr:hypothetical protein [Candidatus Zambryskibacteria bacterium]